MNYNNLTLNSALSSFSKRGGVTVKGLKNKSINIFLTSNSRYTDIDDNRDIQSNNYRYRVNLVCDDIHSNSR